MATDYDAPRRSADDEPDEAIASMVTTTAAARTADGATALEDAADDLETADVPDMLIDGELIATVVPQRADEARCSQCFLVRHLSTLDAMGTCVDCR